MSLSHTSEEVKNLLEYDSTSATSFDFLKWKFDQYVCSINK